MNKRLITAIFCVIGLLLLILDAKTALTGAAEGVSLCLQTIVPVLLPFMVLTTLLTSSLGSMPIPILRSLSKLFGIPDGCESLLLIGMLGGYPSGANASAQQWHDGHLCAEDASRMMVICNLAGPSFLFGIVANQFSNPRIAWYLWIVHILSAIISGILLPKCSTYKTQIQRKDAITVTDAVSNTVRLIAVICGWIVLFRIILAFLSQWFLWAFPASVQVLVSGVLELANGCCELHRIPSEGVRFVIAASMLSFGGLCVTMQTASVARGLPFRNYLPGKLLQAAISSILAILVQPLLFSQSDRMDLFPSLIPVLLPFLCVSIIILCKKKNSSRIFLPVGV